MILPAEEARKQTEKAKEENKEKHFKELSDALEIIINQRIARGESEVTFCPNTMYDQSTCQKVTEEYFKAGYQASYINGIMTIKW